MDHMRVDPTTRRDAWPREAAPLRRRGPRGLAWLVLIALISQAAATSSIVKTVAQLKRAVANSSVTDIILSSEAPLLFNSSWPVSGTGPSALLINRTLTLRAATLQRVVLDAGASASGMRRVLEVSAGARVALVRVEMTGGVSKHAGGGVRVGRGCTLILQDSIVRGNTVLTSVMPAWGGGVVNFGSLTALHSRISGNSATSANNSAWGGGLEIHGFDAVAVLDESHVTGNMAMSSTGVAGGGGVHNFGGTLTAVRCLISGNNATSIHGNSQGGGLQTTAIAMLNESNLDSNAATSTAGIAAGGGIVNLGALTATRCHISGNGAISVHGTTQGGGLENHGIDAVAVLDESNVTGNMVTSRTSFAGGGGVRNSGRIMVARSHVNANSATSVLGFARGGGIDNNRPNNHASNQATAIAVLHQSNINGNAAASIRSPVMGGGVFNMGNLTATYSDIYSNTATSSVGSVSGGGVANQGHMTAMHCRFSGNNATSVDRNAQGGGLMNVAFAVLDEIDVDSNAAASTTGPAMGGGMFNMGNLTAAHSRICSNIATSLHWKAQGGGLDNSGTASIAVLAESNVNSNTATSNTSGAAGGGMHNNGHLTAMRCHVSGNSATSVHNMALGGGLINTRSAITLLNESNIDGNVAASTGGGAAGGGVHNFAGHITAVRSHISGNSATSVHWIAQGSGLFNGGIESNVLLVGSVIIGGNATSSSILNGARISYVLPAPLGRWVPGVVECQRVYCVGSALCPVQPCNLTAHPALEGRHLAGVVAGPIEGDFPPSCAIGSFGDSIAAVNQSGASCAGLCVHQDPFSTTASVGAASATECVCVAGFYAPPSGHCTECAAGATACIGTGATLATLNLTTNYWRLSNATADIRPCVGGAWEPGAPTPCSGGIAAGSYCADARMTGPRCRVCIQGVHGTARRYYDEAIARCVDCPATGAAAIGMAVALGLACTAIFGLTHVLWGELRATLGAVGLVRGIERIIAEAHAVTTYYQIVAKAKLLVGYYQVCACSTTMHVRVRARGYTRLRIPVVLTAVPTHLCRLCS